MIQREDDEGILGVKIGKELMRVAGRALTANITRLGPKVLPLSEQLIFAGNLIARKVMICPGWDARQLGCACIDLAFQQLLL